jgi:hypothetical protein
VEVCATSVRLNRAAPSINASSAPAAHLVEGLAALPLVGAGKRSSLTSRPLPPPAMLFPPSGWALLLAIFLPVA